MEGEDEDDEEKDVNVRRLTDVNRLFYSFPTALHSPYTLHTPLHTAP